MPRQQDLPFADAEAAEAERWNDLVLALHRIGSQCDAEMSAFVRWVYNTTKHDPAAELVRSYRRLAERPLGLCCSPEKARSTVETAERLGLVIVHRRRRFDGAQQDNGYQINWPGIRALKTHAAATIPAALAHAQTIPHQRPPLGPGDQGPGLPDHPPGLPDQGPGPRHHQLRNILSGSSTNDLLNRTGPETGPTLENLFSDIDELREAAQTTLEPLPAGRLDYGIWAPIGEAHIQQPLRLVAWLRGQAAARQPLWSPITEAHALVTIAAALWAQRLRPGQIRSSRAAAWVHLMSRGRWQRAVPYIPTARRLLDEAIAARGPAPLGRRPAHQPTREPAA